MIGAAILVAHSLVASADAASIGGDLPSTIAIVRVAWVAADNGSPDVRCEIDGPRWVCHNLSTRTRGLVVFVGEETLAWQGVAIDVPAAAAQWGRIVRIMPGGVSPEDLHDLQLTAWVPARSAVRPRTRRFLPAPDRNVVIVPLSATTFWVAGKLDDPDAFLSLDGPAVGSARLATSRLAEGPPEQSVLVAASTPVSLVGRVQGRHGEPADAADVDLLERLSFIDSTTERIVDAAPLVRRRTSSTSADGTFRFDHLPAGPFRLEASHAIFGSGGAWLDAASAPFVVIDLTPVRHATGRVLRHGVPVPGARVRFVPDAGAWAVSSDPAALLTREAVSANDGTFALSLPPQPSGTIQAIVENGSAVRAAIPNLQSAGDIALGDIALPDTRRLVVRLLETVRCELTAAGPLGVIGLALVRSTSATNVHTVELPEAGAWALSARCGGDTYSLDPPVVVVPPEGTDPAIDARLVRTRDDS